MANPTKEYSNGEVTVVWEPRACIHSGNCARGLPEVFKPKEKPWVDVNASSSHRIIETVKTCPSGALTIKSNSAMENNATQETSACEVSFFENGPLQISGDFTVTDGQGNVMDTKKKVFLCRCGASENKPFCDGRHKKIGFEAA